MKFPSESHMLLHTINLWKKQDRGEYKDAQTGVPFYRLPFFGFDVFFFLWVVNPRFSKLELQKMFKVK